MRALWPTSWNISQVVHVRKWPQLCMNIPAQREDIRMSLQSLSLPRHAAYMWVCTTVSEVLQRTPQAGSLAHHTLSGKVQLSTPEYGLRAAIPHSQRES
ncbi:hypothetical protein ABBQ38_006708 [Trebouxia sp. C0009 RCD-2024]